jgi:hypothetical protein
MDADPADYLDELLVAAGVVLVGALVWLSDLGGAGLAAYAGVAAVGTGLAGLFVRSWVREWRAAGAERSDRTGNGK